MRVLHILTAPADSEAQRIIDVQAAMSEVTVIDLSKAGLSYDALVEEVFGHDRVFCW